MNDNGFFISFSVIISAWLAIQSIIYVYFIIRYRSVVSSMFRWAIVVAVLSMSDIIIRGFELYVISVIVQIILLIVLINITHMLKTKHKAVPIKKVEL